MADVRDKDNPGSRPATFIGRTVVFTSYLIGVLLLSLTLSILTEWVGMTFIWKDEGIEHGSKLVEREMGYLKDHFRQGIYSGISPAEVATDVSNQVVSWVYVDTGIQSAINRYTRPYSAYDTTAISYLKMFFVSMKLYIYSAIISIQLFSVRLVVVALSLPAYILIAYAALFDGLVKRELRKYGGAIERAFVYHKAKSLLSVPVLILPSIIYLSLPVYLEPQYIFLPSMALLAGTIFITAATFKKYL